MMQAGGVVVVANIQSIRFSFYKPPLSHITNAYKGVRNAFVPRNAFLVSSFPKSGNTYLRFLIFAYFNSGILEYSDMEQAIPYVGLNKASRNTGTNDLYKTHERPSRFYRRGIYLVRDGRSVVASLYRAQLRRNLTQESFRGFLEKFISGSISGYGAWHKHTQAWLREVQQSGDWLLVRYDDLIEDPEYVLQRVLQHLGETVSQSKIQSAVVRSSPENIRNAESRAPQFRKLLDEGSQPLVGGGVKRTWEQYFSEPDLEYFLSSIESSPLVAEFT